VAANTHKAATRRMLAITYRDMYITPKKAQISMETKKHNMREKQKEKTLGRQ
jgi:hypothetical protein